MRKNYVDDIDREYVVNTKLKFAGILQERGWSVKRLSLDAGIPESTLYGWLDIDNPEFMSLPAASKVCRTIGISIHELLADPMWLTIDRNRYLFVRPFMEEPIERVRLFTEFYYRCKEMFSED